MIISYLVKKTDDFQNILNGFIQTQTSVEIKFFCYRMNLLKAAYEK